MIKSTAIFLLCRQSNQHVRILDQALSDHVKTFIIEDNSDYLDSSFNGLCHTKIINLKNNKYQSTAWENAFYFILNYLSLTEIDYFYFIEDDVYSKTPNTFLDLINQYININDDLIASNICSKNDCPNWLWWNLDPDIKYFDEPYKSFNALCRISKNLMIKIYEHQSSYNRFFYHEFLFASLCKKYNLSMVDFNIDKKYIGNIRYRPCFDKKLLTDNKIYHPVKDK